MAGTSGFVMHQSGFWFKVSDRSGPYTYDGVNMNLVGVVDNGRTGFYENRQFRMFIELSIPAGGTLWVKHTIGSNFELHDQRITLKSGSIRWQAIAATASSPGPWTSRTFRRRNQQTTAPLYVSVSVIESSTDPNAATGGIEVDLMVVSAVGNGNTAASIEQNAGLRGLAANIYHVKMFNDSAETAVGVYDWWWEEKP